MKDPIAGQDTTERERQLLEAARRDAAPAAMKAKMALALSPQSLPPSAATSALRAATSPARLLFSHPALWGSLCALVVAGALRWQSGAPAQPERQAPQSSAVVASAPLANAEPVTALAPPPDAATPIGLPAPTATRIATRSTPPRESDLRQELVLLDATRSALAAR